MLFVHVKTIRKIIRLFSHFVLKPDWFLVVFSALNYYSPQNSSTVARKYPQENPEKFHRFNYSVLATLKKP